MGWVCSRPNILTVAHVIKTFRRKLHLLFCFILIRYQNNCDFCLQAQKGSNPLLLRGQQKSNCLNGEYFYPEAHIDVQKVCKATNWYVHYSKLGHFQTALCCLGAVQQPQLLGLFFSPFSNDRFVAQVACVTQGKNVS